MAFKKIRTGGDLDLVQDNLDKALRALTFTQAPAFLTFGAQSTPATTALVFLRPPFGQVAADGNELLWPIPYAGTVSGLLVRAFGGSATQGVVFTARKTLAALGSSAKNTALTATLGAGLLSASDVVHSFTVAAGDLVSVSVQGIAGITGGLTEPRVYLSFRPS